MELMRGAREQLKEVGNRSLSCAGASLVVGSPNSVISVIGRIRHHRHRVGRIVR
jgi:hypothetical protein